MTTIERLERLCGTDGVSGEEYPASREALKLLKMYTDDVTIDAFGSVIARVRNTGEGKPLILLDAHIDQVGMIVTHITEEGFLRVAPMGVDRRLLLAQEVVVHGTRPVKGIVCTQPPHLTAPEEAKKVPEVTDIAIDVGFTKEELEGVVRPGDRVTYQSAFTLLQNGRVTSRSLDDRAGAAAILHALEELGDKPCGFDLVVVFSSQEEAGAMGAQTAAFRLKPDLSITVDVSFAYTSDADEVKCGKMGEGPMIGISPILNRGMFDELLDLAKEQSIPHQIEVMGGRTSTNADAISISGEGVRSALLSIPLKYMHTPIEVVQISDVEAVGNLIAQYLLHCAG